MPDCVVILAIALVSALASALGTLVTERRLREARARRERARFELDVARERQDTRVWHR